MAQRKANKSRTLADGTIQIELTRGEVALVDPADWERVRKYKWCTLSGNGGMLYAQSRSSGKHELMHRVIMGATKGQTIDHENHNTLDNRRANLRFCTSGQSNQNRHKPNRAATSIYKGVRKSRHGSKWTAQCKHQKETLRLGYFNSEADAARAYNTAAQKYHGEFACLNEITGE